MANGIDPDQMLHSVASDLGLHCLQSLSVPIPRIITVPKIETGLCQYIVLGNLFSLK